MLKLLFFISFLSLINCKPVAEENTDTVVVATKLGDIRGVSKDGVRAFHGVPYAQPPVGDLRWRAPQAAESWSPSEYDGTHNRSACPQHCGSVYCIQEMSEDCLFLEIYTPGDASKASNLPVDIYLHGGSFDSMSAASPMYNLTRFVQRSGVIVVLAEYRLGALGFLVTEGSEDDASGNFGILDQRLAFQWVKDNIESFGGDPSKVTLHGQSAGAQSVVIHLTSQVSSGYFRNAIVESDPMALPYKTKSEAIKIGKHLAQSLGCLSVNEEIDMACMKNVDAFEILDKQGGVRKILPDYLDKIQPFAPVLDGDVMSLPPLDALREYSRTTQDPKSTLWGVTSDETRSYVHKWIDKPAPSMASHMLKLMLFADFVSNIYPSTSTDGRDDIITLSTDGLFRCPVRATVEQFHDDGNDAAWVFEWAHTIKSKVPEDYLKYTEKAYHGIEVPFVFQSFPILNLTMATADLEVSNAIIDYYTSFIKFGNPNGKQDTTASETPSRRKRALLPNEGKLSEGPRRLVKRDGNSNIDSLPYWPEARDIENKFSTLVFNQGVSVKETEEDIRCDLWDQRGYEIDLSSLSFLSKK